MGERVATQEVPALGAGNATLGPRPPLDEAVPDDLDRTSTVAGLLAVCSGAVQSEVGFQAHQDTLRWPPSWEGASVLPAGQGPAGAGARHNLTPATPLTGYEAYLTLHSPGAHCQRADHGARAIQVVGNSLV